MPEEKLQVGWEYFLKVPHRKFKDINGFYNDSTEVKVTLPNDDKLCKDLTNVRYEIDRGRLKLEDKKLVKQRLGRSPDTADALALTFAYPVSGSCGPMVLGSGREKFAQDDFQL